MRRRDFLKSALASGALYSIGGLPLIGREVAASGFAVSGSRVLVNIMLVGGPDMRHLLPPPFDANPESYGYRYWEAKARSHSLPDAASAFQNRWENDYFHVSDGTTSFGILGSCDWLKQMWDNGNVAIISNALGARSRNHAHSQLVMDQGNLSSGPGDTNRSGWGGRLAAEAGGNVLALTRTPRIFCYGPDPTDPDGHNNANLVAARNTREFNLYHPPSAMPPTAAPPVITRSLTSYYKAKRREMDPASVYYRFIDQEQSLRRFGDLIDERLSTVPLPTSISALSEGELANPYFGEQIRNLYDSFAASDILALRVASLEYGSWDSHKQQRGFIEPKFSDLFGTNKALDVLYQELPDDILNNMVLVLAGEFGRQLRANGANGTDHGHGNTILVIGNGVNGGVYGDMFPDEELARLDTPSADIVGLTEFDHIFGECCDWVSPGSSSLVFPNRAAATIENGIEIDKLFT